MHSLPQCFAVWLPVVIISLDYNCALLCAISEYFIAHYTTSSYRKFVFAISSPDEFLVLFYVTMFVRNANSCSI